MLNLPAEGIHVDVGWNPVPALRLIKELFRAGVADLVRPFVGHRLEGDDDDDVAVRVCGRDPREVRSVDWIRLLDDVVTSLASPPVLFLLV